MSTCHEFKQFYSKTHRAATRYPCIRWSAACQARASSSVDVEFVALRIGHRHRIVVEAVHGRDALQRGAQLRQPPCLGVDPLPARLYRHLAPAADADVEVKPVLDGLLLRPALEPDSRALAIRIVDRVLPDAQILFSEAEVAPVVVPGRKPCGGGSS
jgi:hypothetical protein